jgi:hypothetical protein
MAHLLLWRRAEVVMSSASSLYCCRLLGLGLNYAHAMPLDRCLVYAVSAGGVEVADALAYFTRSPLRRLAPHQLEDAAPDADIRGKKVYLVDDGLASDDLLLAAASLLRAGEPAHLVMLLPFVRAPFRRAALRVVDQVHTDRGTPSRRPIFDEQPDEDVARCLIERARHYPSIPDALIDEVEEMLFGPEPEHLA